MYGCAPRFGAERPGIVGLEGAETRFRRAGFSRGEPVQALSGYAQRNTVRPRRWIRRYKSCRRVTQNGQVRPQPANCRCGGGLPVDQAACRRIVHSCRQKRRREHDGKAVTRLRPRRTRRENSLPQPPTKNGLHCCKPLLYMVAGDGIEPPTRGFSIPCSTN